MEWIPCSDDKNEFIWKWVDTTSTPSIKMFDTNGDGYIAFFTFRILWRYIILILRCVIFPKIFFFISGTDSEALEILFSDLDTNSIIDAKEF